MYTHSKTVIHFTYCKCICYSMLIIHRDDKDGGNLQVTKVLFVYVTQTTLSPGCEDRFLLITNGHRHKAVRKMSKPALETQTSAHLHLAFTLSFFNDKVD
jgi:hypothetical protein